MSNLVANGRTKRHPNLEVTGHQRIGFGCYLQERVPRLMIIFFTALSRHLLGKHWEQCLGSGSDRLIVIRERVLQLDAQTRQKAVEMIKKHERFNQDFVNRMPVSGGGE